MTRPEIIRADSIDLQDRAAPSAQDSKPRARSNLSSSTLAPHQAETLREVAAETAEENLRSPRVSWANGDVADLQRYAEDLAAGVAYSLTGSSSSSRAMSDAARLQQDALAVAQNGGGPAQNDDAAAAAAAAGDDVDADDGMDDEDDDDMMDKISSSPSIEDEDIDFDFVYALHTFVATVEGQANATKGDTMVLLDDSNSYWWLVRVVKDSSIGYLPAEHIETPTERLARLNKHRNIDLSATMLGDQAEKTKKPIRSAMRRRKAKTVTFAAPTYVDYSDIEYDTDEEDAESEYLAQQQQQQQQQQQRKQDQSSAQQAGGEPEGEDETARVEPLKPRSQQKENTAAEPAKQDAAGDAAASKPSGRTSEEVFETNGVDGPKKTKDGTVRDSFFKDETVETKKITLTPNLLRDDGAPRVSSESKEVKQRPSLDKLEKDNVLTKEERKKRDKDKKEKEKKAGGFRSLFSRKDKRKGEEDDESVGKQSLDVASEGTEKESEDSQRASEPPSPEKAPATQRSTGKLQKQQPRTEPEPTRKPGGESVMELANFIKTEGRAASGPQATMRVVDPEQDDQADLQRSGSGSAGAVRSSSRSRSRTPNGSDARPRKSKKAKARVELDEFDDIKEEDEEDEEAAAVAAAAAAAAAATEAQQAAPAPAEQQKPLERPSIPGAYPDSYIGTPTPSAGPADKAPQPDRLSESPVHISPVQSNNPPALMVDSSSQEEEEDRSSPRSSPSPELVEREDGPHRHQDSTTTSASTTTAASTWNDASLQAFFDSSADIRDLLVVVYDKTDVEPVGPEHPVAGTLFKEQNAKLAEITTQLDNMLGDWLARKQRLRGTA